MGRAEAGGAVRDTYFIIDGREIIVAELTDRELGEAFDARRDH